MIYNVIMKITSLIPIFSIRGSFIFVFFIELLTYIKPSISKFVTLVGWSNEITDPRATSYQK